MKNKGSIVFSTDQSFREKDDSDISSLKNKKQQLRVWRQRLGGGRMVTVVKGYNGPEEELKKLGKQLRSQCSSGGSVKDGEILVQGDHREKIVNFLNNEGYKAKASGG